MNRTPKIGLLGLITDGYEETFPGILERQKQFAKSLAARFAPEVEVCFEELGVNRASIEKIVSGYQNKGLDGILIVMLAYSQGAWLLRAMQDNRLPLAVAVIQTNDEVREDFEELDLTINQGIHGAQDNCNVLTRLGIRFQAFAGSTEDASFHEFVVDFARAAQTVSAFKRMQVGVIGRMHGMGDILTDDMGIFSRLGPEVCHDNIGSVWQCMQQVDAEQVSAEMEQDFKRFEVDSKLTRESHSIAVRMYVGFRAYLEQNGYEAFTAHFDIFGQDGRFRQLPLYAASRLMADGYGYAAEGDLICAAMVKAGHLLSGGPASFTEMYMMDRKTDAILFCHAGESNYACAAAGKTPRLIDRYLGEGGLENPPTLLAALRPGRATLVSMVSVSGGQFRLVVAKGEILDKDDLRRCEMPYFFFRPDSGVKNCVENWLKAGGTHHEVITLGDTAPRWKMFCEMTGVEYCEVS